MPNVRPIKLSKKEWGIAVIAICLALASLRPSDPYVFVPMLLISFAACIYLACYHGGKRSQRFFFVCIAFVILGFIAYRNLTGRKPERRPASPIITSIGAGYHFTDAEVAFQIASQAGPCKLKNRKPAAKGSSKLPLLVLEAQRVVFRHDVLNPSKNVGILLEVVVTNRGFRSIAKDWVLCLAKDNKPSRYMPEEIQPYDNRVSLEQAAIRVPIERGQAVDGWLLFYVDEDVVAHGINRNIECEDYLGQRYMQSFVTAK